MLIKALVNSCSVAKGIDVNCSFSILLGATMKVHTRARSVDRSCSLEHRCTTGCILQVLEMLTNYAYLGQDAQLGAL